MRPNRRLALLRERVVDLTRDELRTAAGAPDAPTATCHTIVECVTAIVAGSLLPPCHTTFGHVSCRTC